MIHCDNSPACSGGYVSPDLPANRKMSGTGLYVSGRSLLPSIRADSGLSVGKKTMGLGIKKLRRVSGRS